MQESDNFLFQLTSRRICDEIDRIPVTPDPRSLRRFSLKDAQSPSRAGFWPTSFRFITKLASKTKGCSERDSQECAVHVLSLSSHQGHLPQNRFKAEGASGRSDGQVHQGTRGTRDR